MNETTIDNIKPYSTTGRCDDGEHKKPLNLSCPTKVTNYWGNYILEKIKWYYIFIRHKFRWVFRHKATMKLYAAFYFV